MKTLSLEEAHLSAGAQLVERDGWLVPASYGDAGGEYEAVRGGAGVGLFDLSSRGRIEVRGKEAVQFLNGLITNDVKTLAPGAWMWAAFPNPQGRLLAFARVVRASDEESFLFDTEPVTRATVFRLLERFTLAGDFKVKDLSDETAQLSLQGARASEIVGALFGVEASRLARGSVAVVSRDNQTTTLARATHTGEDGFDLYVETQSASALWNALVAAGARPVGYDALETLRVEAGVPRYGVDVSETNVVSEAGLDEAVSFTKGCYVGQEIIARIHWRGHVAKKLTGLLLDDDGANEREIETSPAGSNQSELKIKTTDGAREIGHVTSSVFSPHLQKRIALGTVKYDFLTPDTKVLIEVDGVAQRARIVALPFVRGSWYENAEAPT
jgi:folate-binding protein YgfZ